MTSLQLKDDLQQQLDPEVEACKLVENFDDEKELRALTNYTIAIILMRMLIVDGDQGVEGDGEGGVGSTLEGKCCSGPLCSGQVCIVMIIFVIVI